MADFKVIARSNGKLSESALGTGDHLLVSGADGIKVKDNGTIGSASAPGAITVDGSGNVTLAANFTVSGTATTVDTTNLNVEDPLLQLAANNGGADAVDIGFVGKYDTSGSQDLYAGLFRDANDSGKFHLFKDTQEDLSAVTVINKSATGYAVATLVATLEGNVTGNVTGNTSGSSGSCTGNAATATALASGRTFLVDLAETDASSAFTGAGNVSDIGVTGVLANANIAEDLTIVAGTINNSVIGASTAAAATFTTVTVGTNIIHAGDTNNLIGFGTDTQSFETGGTARMNLSDAGLQIGAGSRVTTILDENGLNSDSDTALATQQSIKAYVDTQVGGVFTDFTVSADSGGNQTISNGNTLAINGTTNQISTVASATDVVSIKIDPNVNFTVGTDQSLGYAAASGEDVGGHSINIKGQRSTGAGAGGEVRLWSTNVGSAGTSSNAEVKVFAATASGAVLYQNLMSDTDINASSGTIAFGELVGVGGAKGTSGDAAIIGMHGSPISAATSGQTINLLANGQLITGLDVSAFSDGDQIFLSNSGTLVSSTTGITNNIYQVGFVVVAGTDDSDGKFFLDVKHIMSL